MSKKIKIYSNILLVFFIMTTFSACNYKEINNMPLVNGMGIDKENDSYQITLSVIIPASSIQGVSSKHIVIESTGDTIFDAIRDLIMKDGEKVFFGHLQYILVGHSLASEDIEEAIDLLLRDDEIREDIYLLITREDYTANEIIQFGLENDVFQNYIPTASENAAGAGKYSPITIVDFIDKEKSKGIANVVPIIFLEETVSETRTLIIGGYVIKDKKPHIQLNGSDIRLYRILTNQESGGILTINYKKEDKKSRTSIEVIDTKTKVKFHSLSPAYYGIDLNIHIAGTLAEILDAEQLTLNKDGFKEYEKQAQKQLTDDFNQLISKIKTECGQDIFGFGNKFKIKYPSTFKKIENEWFSVFQALEVNTNVTVEITGTALIPLSTNGGD